MATAPDLVAQTWQDVPPAGSARHGTGGRLVYAIGDVHGCYDLLKTLLARIAADAETRANGRCPVLILLGDYIDRGPMSAQVIEALLWLRRHSTHEVHLLKGNHEQGLLDFIADPGTAADWLKFGAAETFASYDVAPPASPATAALERTRDELLDRMPAAHLHLLQTLEPFVEIGDYAFVHAGIRPGRALGEQTPEDLMWIRRGFLDHGGVLPRMIVHGHSWDDDQPQLRPNRIGIDTGAYSTDTLTALMLDGETSRYVQVRAGASV